jgi:hypothetical protein
MSGDSIGRGSIPNAPLPQLLEQYVERYAVAIIW